MTVDSHRCTILAATANPHKLREIREILEPQGVAVLGADDLDQGLPPVVEDGATFEANAAKKALSAMTATGHASLADDSGLEVMALHGAPGVRSARFAGDDASDGRNTAKLLHLLEGEGDRRARFVCVLAFAVPGSPVATARGTVEGRISSVPAGINGFGYDPVFVPTGWGRSFAELPAAVKNGMSHRGAALRAAVSAGLFAAI